MAVDGLPEWLKGMAITAERLASMVAAIRANRVTVVPGNGLVFSQGASGTTISLAPTAQAYYALISTACPALASNVLGKGAGELFQVTYSSAGVCTLQSTNLTGVPIYNPGNASIASGQRVKVVQFMGQWHVANQFC